MNRRLIPTLFFGAILGFFMLTAPANHSEAEDAYYYARMAEQGSWAEMFHAQHLIYLPLMRMVFRAAQFAGYTGRSFPVLTGISMISGALAVCLFAALLRRAGAKKTTVISFACALLFSYGFWRYSTTVEIYTPAAALSLLTVYLAVRSTERPLFFSACVLTGSFTLLLHLVAIPVVLMAVPLFYILRKQKLRAGLYALTTPLLAAIGYGALIAYGIRPVVFSDALVQRAVLIEPLTWLKALVAWGQTVLSGNFLFGLPATAERIVRLFPFQMLQEELFMGTHAPFWVPFVAPVTFGLASGLAVALLWLILRNFRHIRFAGYEVCAAVLIWLAGTAGMAMCFEPANPEMWVCVLPPFWLLAGLIWSALPDSRLFRWMPVALAAALLLHNWIGGMSLVKNSAGDYCRQKGAWIIGQARPDDLILSADSHSFITLLEYQTPACVMDAKFINPEQWNELERKTSGRIYIFSDVIELLPPVMRRAPDAVQKIQEVSAQLQSGLRSVHRDEFGTVYQWKSL
ncbi:MAG: hypothetical protein WCH86_06385 [Kiritimatiellales bacterium]